MKQTILLFFFIILGASQLVAQNSRSNSPRPSQKVQVIPNPVSNFLALSEVNGAKTIMVFDLVGKPLKKFEAIKGEKYFVGDLPKGMYLVQILDANKVVMTTQRFSKR